MYIWFLEIKKKDRPTTVRIRISININLPVRMRRVLTMRLCVGLKDLNFICRK